MAQAKTHESQPPDGGKKAPQTRKRNKKLTCQTAIVVPRAPPMDVMSNFGQYEAGLQPGKKKKKKTTSKIII